jgi:hypothetical protein
MRALGEGQKSESASHSSERSARYGRHSQAYSLNGVTGSLGTMSRFGRFETSERLSLCDFPLSAYDLIRTVCLVSDFCCSA